MRSTRILRVLFLWFGAYQAAHIVVNVRGLTQLAQNSIPMFPAAPPVDGWDHALVDFFGPLAAMDLLVAVVSVISAIAYFRRASWSVSLGIACLAASIFGFALFASIAVVAGTWEANPVTYLVIYLPVAPVLALFVLLMKPDAPRGRSRPPDQHGR